VVVLVLIFLWEKLFGTGIAATKNYGRYISRRICFRL